MPRRLIIDTDPGIDDAAAILMALGSPEVQVEALTTVFGNTPVQRCTINALRILEVAGRADIPVFQGSARPYDFGEPAFAASIHGKDGLGDAGLPEPSAKAQARAAVLEIVERVMASPGEITIAAIGRLTNVALAISVEPRVADAVQEIVVMGGAVTVPGNASLVASANLIGDPLAADIVYRSGAKIAQIGLDVCDKVEISLVQQEQAWSGDSKVGRFMQQVTPFIQRAYNARGRLRDRESVRFNDVPALAYVIAPELFECRDLYVRVEPHGLLTRGQTVADLDGSTGQPPNAKVALGVDAAGVARLWAERVSSL